MDIRGVLFDIGGVLEYTPDLGVIQRWEPRLGLPPGEIDRRLGSVFMEGCYGRVTEAEVHASIGEQLAIDPGTVDAFMADIWVDYLGTANEELLAYCRSLRGRCPTAILSNSFVGARQREKVHIGVEELCDVVVYSHEMGFIKPEREIYELTCERIGLLPEQLAFLDDNLEYLRGAEEVGIHPIQFTDNATAIAAIERWLGG